MKRTWPLSLPTVHPSFTPPSWKPGEACTVYSLYMGILYAASLGTTGRVRPACILHKADLTTLKISQCPQDKLLSSP